MSNLPLASIPIEAGAAGGGVPAVSPIAYRINDAAKAMGLSRSTLYSLAKQGRLRIRKIAGRSVIAADDLRALLS